MTWLSLCAHAEVRLVAAGWILGFAGGLVPFASAARSDAHARPAVVAASPADWVAVRRGAFSVALPGPPQDQFVALGARVASRVSTSVDGAFYAVYEAQAAADAPPIEPASKGESDTLIDERRFAVDGAPAVHVVRRREGATPTRLETETVMLGARRLVLVVIAPESAFSAERAAQFFGSLSLPSSK